MDIGLSGPASGMPLTSAPSLKPQAQLVALFSLLPHALLVSCQKWLLTPDTPPARFRCGLAAALAVVHNRAVGAERGAGRAIRSRRNVAGERLEVGFKQIAEDRWRMVARAQVAQRVDGVVAFVGAGGARAEPHPLELR